MSEIRPKKVERVITGDDISEAYKRKLLFAEIAAEEERQRKNPETMDIEAPPNIAGLSVDVRLTGYRPVTKPYAQRCKNGHYVPSGAKCFTDDRENYCPFCGEPLDIA